MVFHFLILSGESEDFVLELQLHQKNSFLDFHHAIIEALNFDSNNLASFWKTDENWQKISEATLIDMDEHSKHLMKDINIEDCCRNKGERFLYIFDYFSERSLFIKIVNIIDLENNISKYPTVVRLEGVVPLQTKRGEKYIDDLLNAFSSN